MKSKILLTGSSGLLGQELQKLLTDFDVYAPSSKKLNIVDMDDFVYNCDIVVHSAAYTDLVKAEKEDRNKCFSINVTGTANMLRKYPNTYFVYISTEYVAHPELNIYSYTKHQAELFVKNHSNHLIIRTLFKPRPFPHERAFEDQFTCGDYVDVIAEKIYYAIKNSAKGVVYIGTGRKSIYQLALQTNPNVKPMSVDEIKEVKLQKDYLT